MVEYVTQMLVLYGFMIGMALWVFYFKIRQGTKRRKMGRDFMSRNSLMLYLTLLIALGYAGREVFLLLNLL